MKTRISTRGIALYENKLLAVRLKEYQSSGEPEWWCLPGGKVEESEDVPTAIQREMLEETGVAPDVGELLYVHEFAHGYIKHIEFFFHIRNAHDYIDIDLSQTSHGTKELAELAFIQPSIVKILPKFLQTEDLQKQLKMPTKIISYV